MYITDKFNRERGKLKAYNEKNRALNHIKDKCYKQLGKLKGYKGQNRVRGPLKRYRR